VIDGRRFCFRLCLFSRLVHPGSDPCSSSETKRCLVGGMNRKQRGVWVFSWWGEKFRGVTSDVSRDVRRVFGY
jgi:hypothetical protein